MPELPVLVVGDVHGDLERLFQALKPYPAEKWHTIFLGDLVDGGVFGVGALRYARDRANSAVLMGNHEVAMLQALRDRASLPSWLGLGGQLHDLEELQKDEPLTTWLRARPALVKLPDGTLLQHSDNDGYVRLIAHDEMQPIQAVNAAFREALDTGQEAMLWDLMTPGHVFRRQPARLNAWLQRTASTRVVHGHAPHGRSRPDAYHGGRAISFDGSLSRFMGSARFRRPSPLGASVAPLSDVPAPVNPYSFA